MNRRPPSLLSALTAAGLLGFVMAHGVAQPAGPGFVLKLDGTLTEARTPSQALPAYARAWVVEGRPEEQTTLIGDAEVRRAGSVIRGDRITYTSSTDELVATGNVRVTRDGNVFTGPALHPRP